LSRQLLLVKPTLSISSAPGEHNLMSLNLSQKKAVIAEVAEVAAQSHSVIASEYRGLTVEQLTSLRAKAREQRVYLRVVKNTLAQRALQGTDFESINESLKGPLILAFSQEEPGAGAKLLKEFLKNKENDKLIVKTLCIGNQVLPATELDKLASLPTKEEAISLLMACLKAPLDKLARTFNEVPGKLVRTVEAVRLKKTEETG
jgi:large subunit ribosomal protein L10